MGFSLILFLISLSVSALNGQLMVRLNRNQFTRRGGALGPVYDNWNDLEDSHRWNSIETEPSYLTTNSIDGLDYQRRYTDPSVDYVIVADVIPARKTKVRKFPSLEEFLHYNKINAMIGSRFADNSVYGSDDSLPGHPFNGLIGLLKPSTNRRNVNLIPESLISSRPFRLSTLASIGYGPQYRYYP